MPTRYASGVLFDPATADVMHAAFEAAWKNLQDRGSFEANPHRAGITRERLALRIIETAQNGERDVDRLRDDSLAHLADGNSASTDSDHEGRGEHLPSSRGRPPAQSEDRTGDTA